MSSGFKTAITIYDALRNIEEGTYLLPSFQREFQWDSERIQRLFDSLMQNYPISSMLFWKVKSKTSSEFSFYRFIDKFIQAYKTHNDEEESVSMDFRAVLDGQQRLTALNIGLKGSYAWKNPRKRWEYTPQNYPTRKLYLCLNRQNNDEDSDEKYLFRFLKINETKDKDIYRQEDGSVWFKLSKIFDLHLKPQECDIDDFCENENLDKESKKVLRAFDNVVFVDRCINYYEEESQEPDTVVKIFTRINSGGITLSFSQIMFALLTANWGKSNSTGDVRTEVYGLIDRINNKGFSIDVDYIIKAILFLHHKSVKSLLGSFSKTFCGMIEKNWDKIRDSIEALFDLIKSFGFDALTLTSNNSTLPILYWMYHKNIYKDFKDKVSFSNDRKVIKTWLITVLLRRAFSGQTDAVLSSVREAFTSDFENIKVDEKVLSFPDKEIMQKIGKYLSQMDDDFIDDCLAKQKDDRYSFSILALLYPHLDYKNNNFHKDHLHPDDRYQELTDQLKDKYPYELYNSIVNLQMLDANENESKGKKMLKDWVDEELKKGGTRLQFLESHIIPDVDLSLNNFDEFYQKRKDLLKAKIKQMLSY